MGNIINIARKEFSDLLSSKLVAIVLLVYSALIIVDIFHINSDLSTQSNVNLVPLLSNHLLDILSIYGTFIGIIIGFSIIATEKFDNALNTLIVKPIYRDTVINGKFLGAIGFISCVFALVISLYLSAFLAIFGNSISPVLWDFILRTPLIFMLSLVYVMIFLSLAMLLSLIVREQAFALLLGILVLFISNTITEVAFAGNIALLFGASQEQVLIFLMGLSPYGMMMSIFKSDIFNPSINFFISISSVEVEIIKLVICMIVAIVLNYIVFLRRDVI